MFSDTKVKRDLPILREKLKRLQGLAKTMPPKGFTYDEGDHFAMMSLAFLAKQKEHAASLVCLIDGGHGRDAGLIARSMIEGLAQLKWASLDLEVRPLRWRAFTYICDWRLMKKLAEEGETPDPEVKVKIDYALKEYGDQFLTRRGVRSRQDGNPLPDDPYSKTWLGQGYSTVFAQVEDEILKKNIYSPYSAWHHWSPDAMGAAIHRTTAKVTYLPPSPRDSALALAVAFKCLYQTTASADLYFGLGFSEALQQVVDDYIASIRGLAS